VPNDEARAEHSMRIVAVPGEGRDANRRCQCSNVSDIVAVLSNSEPPPTAGNQGSGAPCRLSGRALGFDEVVP
jgi:hypothetical protein